MCIVLVTTGHPDYALIAIDNRDEYILRPTSRPHWWKTQSDTPNREPKCEVEILSSRDEQRAERGTWLGMTKGGNFAVLTNYRELNTHDAAHPVHAKRSRGGMVTAWLGAHPDEGIKDFVNRMLEGREVKDIGGFSLLCGKLRKVKGEKRIEPLAIMSNRSDHIDEVPWIAGDRGTTCGLSNAIYVHANIRDSSPQVDLLNGAPEHESLQEEEVWPKIKLGQKLLRNTVAAAARDGLTEEQLCESLFKILDADDFPATHDMDLEEGIPYLKDSIFVPAFGGKSHQAEFLAAQARGPVPKLAHNNGAKALTLVSRPDDQPNGFQTGLYGTQRQTVILVDWEGNVTYRERALWDENGNPIPRGQGDETFRFTIDGFVQEEDMQKGKL